MSKRMHAGLWMGWLTTLAAVGCNRASPAPAPAPRESVSAASSAAPSRPLKQAALGQPAPEFELSDLDGHPVKLSSFRGKAVVLEWFNPECPFVRASHTKGSLRDLASREAAKGVVWLAVNSGAPGKQGAGAEASAAGQRKFGLSHPVLLDPSGDVGHAYGARHTPHMFVIDEKGVLVYRGAIDNSPDGEGESPQGGTLVNYVQAALGDLAAKQPVKIAETDAYGCSVKYAIP